ncbi:hypothetical protein D1AOALGA4SA_7958 [Olavius algarvensis Delta 1 endosymbiont]|nr:hypothetical protein D1AOALGA4SA_7958 [Olavius algarvensis Delta 1 endosymbiont]
MQQMADDVRGRLINYRPYPYWFANSIIAVYHLGGFHP